jgi:hypothetical protein
VNIVAVLLLALLVAGIPAGAEATDVKITVKSGTEIRQGHIHHSPQRQPNLVSRPVAPVVVIPQPVYFSVPQRCVVPGYWAYAWVPQSYVSNVLVPGYYDYDALWVEAHYEPRAYTWGYDQPYWVPENAC